MLKLLSWSVGNGCCDHDCHGSLHRAFVQQMGDRLFMKSVYKQFAALRGGFSVLVDHAWEWVSTRLHYKDWDLPGEDQEQLWRVLGLEPSWSELLAELQLRFEDGCLCVAAAHAGDPHIIRKVVRAQLRAWQFSAWTESRWLSIGGRARTMILCTILGIKDLVRFCIETKGASTYNLGGFEPTDAIMEFLAVVGLSAFVSESPLELFFKDDRLALIMERVEAELNGEQEALLLISASVWKFLASVAGMPPQQMRHRVVHAGQVQASYLLWRCKDLERLPWSLCRGDLVANLEVLAAGPRPVDHCVASHGSMWAQLTDQQKAGWQQVAQTRRHQAKRETEEKLQEAYKKQKLMQDEMKQIRVGPLTLTSCRFSAAELLSFDQMWWDPQYSHSKVEQKLEDMQRLLEPIGSHELATLAAFSFFIIACREEPSLGNDNMPPSR